MTLSKTITDAIDAYAKAVEWTVDDARQHQHFAALAAVAETRAALEAAIAKEITERDCTITDLVDERDEARKAAAAIQPAPVEPPTDNPPMIYYRSRGYRPSWVEERWNTAEPKVEPPTDAEVEAWRQKIQDGYYYGEFHPSQDDIDTAVALMRRARATGSLERLLERVQKRLGESMLAEDEYQTLLEMQEWIDKERGAKR